MKKKFIENEKKTSHLEHLVASSNREAIANRQVLERANHFEGLVSELNRQMLTRATESKHHIAEIQDRSLKECDEMRSRLENETQIFETLLKEKSKELDSFRETSETLREKNNALSMKESQQEEAQLKDQLEKQKDVSSLLEKRMHII